MNRGFALVMAGAAFLVALSTSARDLDKLYEKTTARLKTSDIQIYVACDDTGRQKGLMDIYKLPENTGMLFAFAETQTLNFWMKNTRIPLQIAYLNEDATIVDIQTMPVNTSMVEKTPRTYPSAQPARFALEMNVGWFDRHKIKVGDHLKFTGAKAKCELLPKARPERHSSTK